jgi:hypothetical protein
MGVTYALIAVAAVAILGSLGYCFYEYSAAREDLKNIYVSIASAVPWGVG